FNDLAKIGMLVEWYCIPAAAVGAPHRRDRVWIVAACAWLQPGREEQRAELQRTGPGGEAVADADIDVGQQWRKGDTLQGSGRRHTDRSPFVQDVADADSQYGWRQSCVTGCDGPWAWAEPARSDHWLVEPGFRRMVGGVYTQCDGDLNAYFRMGADPCQGADASRKLRNVWEQIAARAASQRTTIGPTT